MYRKNKILFDRSWVATLIIVLSIGVGTGCDPNEPVRSGTNAGNVNVATNSQPKINAIRQFDDEVERLKSDLEKNPPPVKLVNPPYLKGKVIAIGSNYVNPEDYAHSFDEAQSAVRVECKKGKVIGQYKVFLQIPGIPQQVKAPRNIPIYANQCDVSVIDITIPAIIAKRTFVNSKAPTRANLSGVIPVSKYVCTEPEEQITAFIKKLVRK